MKLSPRLPGFRQLLQSLRWRAATRAAVIPRVRLPRREVLMVAAAGVLAAGITLIVLVASFNAQERRAAQQRSPQTEKAGSLTGARGGDEISVDDFLLPSLHPAGSVADYYPFRPRLPRWSRENVERFWVSPRQIAIETIGAINDRNTESMLEKVK